MFENVVDELYSIIGVAYAAILGFCVGFERKLRSKEAGIRTHTIVSLGAALMMVVSRLAFNEGDPGRIAAQIVTGIGFLGAGIIVYKKNEVNYRCGRLVYGWYRYGLRRRFIRSCNCGRVNSYFSSMATSP